MVNLTKYEQHHKEPFAGSEWGGTPAGEWLLSNIPEKPNNLLDVGCGTGVHTKFFNEQGIEASGITINVNEIEKRVHNSVMYGDMLDIPFPDKTFDCVFCLGTLEHTHAPFIALCEFNRVLKDNGYLFLDMCGIGCTYLLDDKFWYHKSVLFPIQIKDLLQRTNFTVIDGRYEDKIENNRYETAARANSYYLAKKLGDLEFSRSIGAMVLAKYDDIFNTFATSYVNTQTLPLVVLDDGLSDGIKEKYSEFTYIDSMKGNDGYFSFAKTVNKGFDYLHPNDVMFYSDDCFMRISNIHRIFSNIACSELIAGLIVPLMTNVYNRLQHDCRTRGEWKNQDYIVVPDGNGCTIALSMTDIIALSMTDISAVCFYLKRDVIDAVGKFDTNFVGAGEYADLDYSIRIREAGYKHIIAQHCFVEHGGEQFDSKIENTRRRATPAENRQKDNEFNKKYFESKWNLS